VGEVFWEKNLLGKKVVFVLKGVLFLVCHKYKFLLLIKGYFYIPRNGYLYV